MLGFYKNTLERNIKMSPAGGETGDGTLELKNEVSFEEKTQRIEEMKAKLAAIDKDKDGKLTTDQERNDLSELYEQVKDIASVTVEKLKEAMEDMFADGVTIESKDNIAAVQSMADKLGYWPLNGLNKISDYYYPIVIAKEGDGYEVFSKKASNNQIASINEKGEYSENESEFTSTWWNSESNDNEIDLTDIARNAIDDQKSILETRRSEIFDMMNGGLDLKSLEDLKNLKQDLLKLNEAAKAYDKASWKSLKNVFYFSLEQDLRKVSDAIDNFSQEEYQAALDEKSQTDNVSEKSQVAEKSENSIDSPIEEGNNLDYPGAQFESARDSQNQTVTEKEITEVDRLDESKAFDILKKYNDNKDSLSTQEINDLKRELLNYLVSDLQAKFSLAKGHFEVDGTEYRIDYNSNRFFVTDQEALWADLLIAINNTFDIDRNKIVELLNNDESIDSVVPKIEEEKVETPVTKGLVAEEAKKPQEAEKGSMEEMNTELEKSRGIAREYVEKFEKTVTLLAERVDKLLNNYEVNSFEYDSLEGLRVKMKDLSSNITEISILEKDSIGIEAGRINGAELARFINEFKSFEVDEGLIARTEAQIASIETELQEIIKNAETPVEEQKEAPKVDASAPVEAQVASKKEGVWEGGEIDHRTSQLLASIQEIDGYGGITITIEWGKCYLRKNGRETLFTIAQTQNEKFLSVEGLKALVDKKNSDWKFNQKPKQTVQSQAESKPGHTEVAPNADKAASTPGASEAKTEKQEEASTLDKAKLTMSETADYVAENMKSFAQWIQELFDQNPDLKTIQLDNGDEITLEYDEDAQKIVVDTPWLDGVLDYDLNIAPVMNVMDAKDYVNKMHDKIKQDHEAKLMESTLENITSGRWSRTVLDEVAFGGENYDVVLFRKKEGFGDDQVLGKPQIKIETGFGDNVKDSEVTVDVTLKDGKIDVKQLNQDIASLKASYISKRKDADTQAA